MMNKYFLIMLSMLAIICLAVYFLQSTTKPQQEDSYKDLPKDIYTEHFQPKMKKYLTQPLTVENTEIKISDPPSFQIVTPKQHAAIVQFMNEVMKSGNNRSMSSYNWSTASDCSFRLICKKPNSTYIDIDVYDRFIKTSDDEWLIPEPHILKNLIHGIFYEK